MARRARLGSPEHIGGVLLRAPDARPPSPAEALPVEPRDWELAVGTKIARRARPLRLERGVLHVRTATSTWAQELSLLADTIVAQLRGRGLDVRSLRFHVGSVEPLPRPAWRTETRTAPGAVALPPAVKASLARVDSPELRDAIARAAAASLGYDAAPPPPRAPAPARTQRAAGPAEPPRGPAPARARRASGPAEPPRAPAAARAQRPRPPAGEADGDPATSQRSAAPDPRSAARRSAPPARTTTARRAAPRGSRGGS